jgi:hypothetical protein
LFLKQINYLVKKILASCQKDVFVCTLLQAEMTTIMKGKKHEEGEEGIEQELARVKELLTTLSKVSG